DKRHLAEQVALDEFGNAQRARIRAFEQLDLARLDQVHAFAGLALDKNKFARLVRVHHDRSFPEATTYADIVMHRPRAMYFLHISVCAIINENRPDHPEATERRRE